jgi:ATP-dependent exoDNAse (exonuclease V) beta subunit
MSKNFVVYASSAGSGKTYTLVKEYLSLCLKNNNPFYFSKILAITFTNAAASEMKQRVMDTLKQLAEADESDEILADYAQHTGLNRSEIKSKAYIIYINILYNYSQLSITTIDKFMLKIIRTFSKELYLNHDFETETNNTELLSMAVKSIIQDSINYTELNELIIKYIQTKLDNEKDWNIEKEILNLGQIIFKEHSQGALDKLRELHFKDFIAAYLYYTRQQKQLLTEIKAMAREGKKLIHDKHLQPDDFHQGKRGLYGYLEKIINKNDFNEYAANSYVLEAINQYKIARSKLNPQTAAIINSIAAQLQNILYKLHSFYENNIAKYNLYDELTKNIYATALLSEINKRCEAIKRDNNYILISDFNKQIWKIVQYEPVPYIYERIGERYHHLLIDEFQDTSDLQWKNLLPLIENNLSKGYYNMLVGDAKQAIYRWRDGKAEQFINLPMVDGADVNALLKERENVLRREHVIKTLNTNRRSLGEIIDFNNRFFLSVIQSGETYIQKIFEGHTQEKNNKPGGYVEIYYCNKKNKETEEKEEAENINDEATTYTINTIEKCLNSGYKASDIAILLRSKKEISDIGIILKNLGYEIYSQESLLLKNSPEVNLLIAFAQSVLHPDESFFLYQIIIYYYQSKISHHNLADLIAQQQENIKTYKSIDYQKLTGNSNINLNERYLLSLPLYEFFIKLCDIFTIDKKNIYVAFFLENIFNLQKKQNTLFDVTEWWDKNELAVITPPGENSIQLMTIHKSKGLQFPVVIIPSATWAENLHKQNLWLTDVEEIKPLPAAIISLAKEYPGLSFENFIKHERNMAKSESLNLLYVALTRAQERLYMAITPNNSNLCKYFDSFLKNIQKNISGIVYTQGNETDKLETTKPVKNSRIIFESVPKNTSTQVIFSTANRTGNDKEPTSDKALYGNLVHAFIAKGNKEKADKLMHKMLLSGIDKTLLKDAYHESINAFKQINNIIINEQKILYEAEIVDSTGKIFRPDIIAEDNNGWITLIDIKTGTEKTDRHSEQLQNYADIIIKSGKKIKKMYLLYTSDNKLIEV